MQYIIGRRQFMDPTQGPRAPRVWCLSTWQGCRVRAGLCRTQWMNCQFWVFGKLSWLSEGRCSKRSFLVDSCSTNVCVVFFFPSHNGFQSEVMVQWLGWFGVPRYPHDFANLQVSYIVRHFSNPVASPTIWLVVSNMFLFSIIYGIILLIDFHIFKMVKTTNQPSIDWGVSSQTVDVLL